MARENENNKRKSENSPLFNGRKDPPRVGLCQLASKEKRRVKTERRAGVVARIRVIGGEGVGLHSAPLFFSLASVVASFEASSREKRRPVYRRRLFHGRLSLNVCDARTMRREERRIGGPSAPTPLRQTSSSPSPVDSGTFLPRGRLTWRGSNLPILQQFPRRKEGNPLDARVHLHFPFRSQF